MNIFLTNFSQDLYADSVLPHVVNTMEKYSSHRIVKNVEESDVIFVQFIYQNNYVFEPKDIKNKPIIILDVNEVPEYINKSYFIGFDPILDTSIFPEGMESGYIKLDRWLKERVSQIKAYFKREFFINCNPPPVPTYPIDFCNYSHSDSVKNEKVSTFEEFHNRFFDISFIFGLSNFDRMKMYSEIIKQYNGYKLCTDERMLLHDDYTNINDKAILLLYRPWYLRVPFVNLYKKSKIVLSIFGVGRKCCRDAEACVSSVMALQDKECHFAFPWIDGKNCITLPNKTNNDKEPGLHIDEINATKKIFEYLNNPKKLYEIYLNGIENAKNYYIDNYLIKYLIPKIESVL